MKNLIEYALLAIMIYGFAGCHRDPYVVFFDNYGGKVVCNNRVTDKHLRFDRSEIDSDGFLDIGDCKVVFSNGYVDEIQRYIDTKKYPGGVQITSTVPQSYYEEMRRAKEEKEETEAKEREQSKQKHIAKCMGGNAKSCEEVVKKHSLNCNDYMKVIKKGCTLGSGICCAFLGDEYNSISVYSNYWNKWESKYGKNCSLKNQSEAFKFYRKACELGESDGCARYSEFEMDLAEIEQRERDKTQKSDITIRRK